MKELAEKARGVYQFQSVDGMIFDVLHDISVHHPLRYSDKLPFLHLPLNSSKFQDVRMGKCTPEDDFFAKLLDEDSQDCIPSGEGNIVDTHFPYLQDIVLLRDPQGLHCNKVS